MLRTEGAFILRDLTGYRSGRLVAKTYLGRTIGKWECQCDCGKTISVRTGNLTKTIRPTRSCGCLQRDVSSAMANARSNKPRKDLIGLQIGRLTVVKFGGVYPDSNHLVTRRLTWICQCECGNLVRVRGSSLTCPRPTRSCGCLQNEYRHSSKQIACPPKPPAPPRPRIAQCTGRETLPVEVKSDNLKNRNRTVRSVMQLCWAGDPPSKVASPEFSDWLAHEYNGMKRRCEDDNHPYYHLFGGSGIKVGWSDFEAFEKWILGELGTRSVGTKLVRIDRYGHFEVGNLRWSAL